MAPARERITAYALSSSRKRDPFLRRIPFFGPAVLAPFRRAGRQDGEKAERIFGGDRASLLIIGERSSRGCIKLGMRMHPDTSKLSIIRAH